MKRIMIWTGLATVVFLVTRRVANRVGPAVRARCAEGCEQMLASMPDSFPPKRMMSDLKAVKEQTARILTLVESSPATTASSQGSVARAAQTRG